MSDQRPSKTRAPIRTSRDIGADPRSAQRRDVKLGYLIHDVSRLRRHAFDHLMKPYGVTRSQWWVLGQLMRQDGMTQTQLANMLDVGRASLGAILSRLETGGFITRTADAVDRRANKVHLTQVAHQLIQTMIEQEKGFNQLILKDLSPSDRDALTAHLSSIKTALLGIVADESPLEA